MAVLDTSLATESRDRYLTYALSVISGRALPDVRDGLKPVQRRILYAMYHELHLSPTSSHRKSASVVGAVLAHFHPHGDIACYEAMVRMAQEFSLRYPLVDGQGNFGSLDGDSPAAYRYTEVKLRPLALEVIGEIAEGTVAFRDNFDGTVQEPVVFPSRVPNLLINGVTGIAVGMATSIPPHNLREVIKALLELIDDPQVSDAKLASLVRGPDFPTACQILNSKKELQEIYQTGRGAIRMRADWHEEEGGRGKRLIVISSIPYAINKATLVENIANLIIEKKVPQLVDVRDESTDKVRIVLELAANSQSDVAMAYLFKHTALETNFPVNMTALVPAGNGLKPEILSLRSILAYFLKFRTEVTEARLVFEKKNLSERIHILQGLMVIFDRLEEVIKIVRKSDGRSDAAEKLMARFDLDEIQAFAVVDMRIYQLSKTSLAEIKSELKAKGERVSDIDAILKSSAKILSLVKKDLEQVAADYGDKRLSCLEREPVELEFNEEAYVVHEDVYAIITKDGWIKRIRQNNEIASTRIREGDAIVECFPLSTTDSVVFFTNMGSVYCLRVTDFPASGGYGEPIQKALKFKDGERVVASFALRAQKAGEQRPLIRNLVEQGSQVLLVSQKGVGFVLNLNELTVIKKNGKRAIKLREGDQLAAVCKVSNEVVLLTQNGAALGIKIKEAPVNDHAVVGVVLMGIRSDDALVAAVPKVGEKFVVLLSSGRTKELAFKEITFGHRALKGNRVIAREQIVGLSPTAESR